MSEQKQYALPKSKFDVAVVEAICALPDSSIDPADLLWCLGDRNWPIAHPAAARLVGLGDKAVPAVRVVLSGTDSSWKYDVLAAVVSRWPRTTIAQLQPDLERLVLGDGTDTGTDLMALELLVEHRLSTMDFLRKWVEFKLRGARAVTDLLENLQRKLD